VIDPTYPRLTMSKIYREIKNEEEEPNTYDMELDQVFSPIQHSHVDQNLINPDIFDLDGDHDVYHWLPVFLSLNFWIFSTVTAILLFVICDSIFAFLNRFS